MYCCQNFEHKKGIKKISQTFDHPTDELIIQLKRSNDEPTDSQRYFQIDFNLLPENPLKLKVYGNKELLSL